MDFVGQRPLIRRRRADGAGHAGSHQLALLVALLAASAALAGACDSGDEITTAASASAGEPVYGVSATVLESPEHGPHLCRGQDDSYPPQCTGTEIVGWDWALVDGEESANGTTWGGFYVTGTWDGTRLSVVRAPGPPRPRDLRDDVDFSTPCPTPAGGWAVVDPSTATHEALDQVGPRVREHPAFAGLWVDQTINPALADGVLDADDEELADDPAQLVVNVRTTGDVEAVTAELRQVWGGALCVSPAARTYAEVEATEQQISALPGVLSANASETDGVVNVLVVIADESTTTDLQDRFPDDTLEIRGWLQPTGLTVPAAAGSALTLSSSQDPTEEVPASGEELSPVERIEVTLWHCGINTITFDGAAWEVPNDEEPFDATNALTSFVGQGTIERVALEELRYVDGSGLVLRFVPDDAVEPPCE